MSIADKIMTIRNKLDDALNHCNEALTERNIETANTIYDVGNKIKSMVVDNTVRNSIIEGTITEFNDEKVSFINECMFNECSLLTTINLPACTSVYTSAFANCSSLTIINLPACTTIGNSAFKSCTSLTSANLPICSYIGYSAFYNCTSLLAIILAYSSVVSIDNSYAFYNTPLSQSTYTGTFGSIYVPASLVDAYKTANYWSVYADRITAMEVLNNE